MTSLTLYFSNQINKDLFKIKVDSELVNFSVCENCLSVDNIDIGFHLLQLELTQDADVEIVDAKIDGITIRHLLFLGYKIVDQSKQQPCTKISNKGDTLVLPFANPASWWIESVINKLPQSFISQGIHKDFCVYYPGTVKIPDTFPKVVKDFFEKNYNFTAIERSKGPTALPYVYANIDTNDVEPLRSVIDSVDGNPKFEKFKVDTFPQDIYNQKDDPNWKPAWRYYVAAMHDYESQTCKFNITREDLPELHDLLDKLKVQDIFFIYLSFLEPGGYISPHMDDKRVYDKGYERFLGCNQIYLPLSGRSGSYMKFGSAGIIDISKDLTIINNSHYTHSVVNTTQEKRAMLMLKVNPNKNQHLYKQWT